MTGVTTTFGDKLSLPMRYKEVWLKPGRGLSRELPWFFCAFLSAGFVANSSQAAKLWARKTQWQKKVMMMVVMMIVLGNGLPVGDHPPQVYPWEDHGPYKPVHYNHGGRSTASCWS